MPKYVRFTFFILIFCGLLVLTGDTFLRTVKAAVTSTPLRTWMPDYLVQGITGGNGKLYLTGSFNYFGPNYGNAYPVSKSTGQPLSGYVSTIEPEVMKVLPDGSGGWFIGGNLRAGGYTSVKNLLHVLSDGSVDTNFNPQLPDSSSIYDMILSGGVLYVGGQFTSIGGATRNNIAAIDPTTGTATAWDPGTGGTNSRVYSIAISGDTLYVGGSFTAAGGQTRNRAAAFEISTGNLLPWDPNVTGFAWTVRKINVNGSAVYLGGAFSAINSITRNKLAVVDATTGTLFSWDPNLNGDVYDMYRDGSYLYVSGDFTTTGATTRKGLVRYEISSSTAPTLDSWDPIGSASAQIYALDSDGTDLYVGGYFNGTVGGQTRRNLVAISQSTGLATSWNPQVSSYPKELAVSGSTVYIGNSGYFMSPGGFWDTGKLIEFDIASGVATQIVSPSNGTFSGIDEMILDGTTLYVAGDFSNLTINGVSRSYLAALDTTTWQFTSWNPQATNRVRDIKMSGDYLYVGGEFEGWQGGIGGNSNMWYLARFNKNTGVLDATWLPDVYNDVYSMAVSGDGSTLYIGGKFNQINSSTRNAIGAISTATALVTSWNPDASAGCFNKTVESMVLSGTTLYVGGCFDTIGGALRNYVAALDTTVDTNNALPFNPDADDVVTTMSLMDNVLYMGGYFTHMSGQVRQSLAAFNTQTNSLESFAANLGANPYIGYAENRAYKVYTYGGALFVGGDFHHIGGDLQSDLSNFTSITFQSYFAQFGSFIAPTTPTIEFASTTSSGSESATSSSITLSLSATSASNVTVSYAVTGGTATGGGVDYTLASGTATIIAGSLSTTIPFTVVNDSDVESDETIIVTISNPTNATLGTSTTHTYTITNNDVASSGGGGGGGSGGGNGPIVGSLVSIPKNSVIIEKGEDKVKNHQVTLHITHKDDVTDMIVSNNSDFKGAKKEKIVAEKKWDLCNENILECPPGLFKVHVKFLDAQEVVTEVISKEVVVEATSTHSISVTPPAPPTSQKTENKPIAPTPVVPKHIIVPPNNISPTTVPPRPTEDNLISSTTQKEEIATGTLAIIENIPSAPLSTVPPVEHTSISGTVVGGGGIVDFFNVITTAIQEIPFVAKEEFSRVGEYYPRIQEKAETLNKVVAYAGAPVSIGLLNAASIQEKVIRLANLKDVSLVATQAMQGMLAFLGVRRKRRYWGTVYDSKTKQPIDPVLVQLVDAQSGKVVEEAITDMAGRYGFLSRSGSFYITAEKTHYSFPSTLVAGKQDEIFENVYHGESFNVFNDSYVVAPNIPMDPVAFDWNQLDKKRIIHFHPRTEYLVSLMSRIFYWSGFIISLVVYTFNRSTANLSIIALYILILVISVLLARMRLWGRVLGAGDNAIADAIIELTSLQFKDTVISKAKSAPDGKFFLKADKGTYNLRIKKQGYVPDQIVDLGSQVITVQKEGVVNTDIHVR